MSARLFVPVLHGAAAERPDEADTAIAAGCIRDALQRLGYHSEILHLGLDLDVIAHLAERHPALVFNMVEALDGDAGLAALAPAALDRHRLAYSGASAESWRLTLTKTLTKQQLAAAGLPTPAWSEDGSGFAADSRVIVKSIAEHASLGLDAASVVPAPRARAEIADRLRRFGGTFFAEAFVEGREFNLSVLESEAGPRVLPIAEIDFVDFPPGRPHIVDYEAKWDEDSFAYRHTPRRFDFPESDRPLLDELAELALAAWRLFKLSGYARVDFRVDGAGHPWILEVNVNPCLTPDAGFVAAAARAGLGYDEIIACIVERALKQVRAAA